MRGGGGGFANYQANANDPRLERSAKIDESYEAVYVE